MGGHTLVGRMCWEAVRGIGTMMYCGFVLQDWLFAGRSQVSSTFLRPPQRAAGSLSWRRGGQLLRAASCIPCPWCITHLSSRTIVPELWQNREFFFKLLIFYIYFPKDIGKLESVAQIYKIFCLGHPLFVLTLCAGLISNMIGKKRINSQGNAFHGLLL